MRRKVCGAGQGRGRMIADCRLQIADCRFEIGDALGVPPIGRPKSAISSVQSIQLASRRTEGESCGFAYNVKAAFQPIDGITPSEEPNRKSMLGTGISGCGPNTASIRCASAV